MKNKYRRKSYRRQQSLRKSSLRIRPSRKASRRTQKATMAEFLVAGGMLSAVSIIVICLFTYFRPFTREDVVSVARTMYSHGTEQAVKLKTFIQSHIPPPKKADPPPVPDPASPEAEEEVPYMERSSEMGELSEMQAASVFPAQEDAIYVCMLDTPLGPLLYYNQGDLRWKEYLYGGSDRISKYGCGPVCVSMIINSFTPNGVTPVEIADWAAENGYHAKQGGSYHGLIPGSLSAFGLQVDSVTDRTAENARELLRTGHILVALMGQGSLTQNGHFIIIAQLAANGNVYIADPASYSNSTKEWDLQLLMDELKKVYDSGGPLWAVSFAKEEG